MFCFLPRGIEIPKCFFVPSYVIIFCLMHILSKAIVFDDGFYLLKSSISRITAVMSPVSDMTD
jgi:hypothetical protein